MALVLEKTEDVLSIPVSSANDSKRRDLFGSQPQENLGITKINGHQSIGATILKQEYFKIGLGCAGTALLVYGLGHVYSGYAEWVTSEYLDQVKHVTKLGSKFIEFSSVAKQAAVANKDFEQLSSIINSWTNGPLGKGMALMMLLMGGAMGITKQSVVPAITGMIGACILSFGPDVINNILGVEGTNSQNSAITTYEKSTDTIEKAVSKLNKELVAQKGLKIVLQDNYLGKTLSSASFADVSEYVNIESKLSSQKLDVARIKDKSETIKSQFGSSLLAICGGIIGLGLVLPVVTARRKLKKIKG